MKGYDKICNSVYWLCLVLWISALVSAGVTASFNFATLPDIGITLEQFSEYETGNFDAHGRLAAGMVLEKVFTMTDFVQVALGPITGFMLLLQFTVFRMPFRRLSNIIRTSCVAIALVMAGYHIFLQAPMMNSELRQYWSAAAEGDVEGAKKHQAVFETLHPRAELILEGNLILLLIAVVASATAMTPANKPPKQQSSNLQEPELLKS